MLQRNPWDVKSVPEAMWLTGEQIKYLKDLELAKGFRHHRKEINATLEAKGITWKCPYSILSAEDGLYAIYRTDEEFSLGDGGTAQVKALQKLALGQGRSNNKESNQ